MTIGVRLDRCEHGGPGRRRTGPGRASRLAAWVVSALALTLGSSAGHAQDAAGPALRLVVIAGEDAVNVIQQQTAVAPIVEVRDKNDQPVAGALVRFAIRGGRGATFAGRRAVSLTTDATGRAAVGSLAPGSAGPVQIDVTATFQGQVARTTIAQTTVTTPAEAARARSSASSPGATRTGTSGAAPAGGVSAVTLGVVGGVALGAAGVVVAAGARDDGGGPPTGGGTPPAGGGPPATGGGTAQTVTLTGPVTLPVRYDVTFTSGDTCRYTYTTTATARMALQVQPRGDVSGRLEFVNGATSVSTVCSGRGAVGLTDSTGTSAWEALSAPVSGTSTTLTATAPGVLSFPDGAGATVTHTWDTSVAGTLANGAMSGTLSRTLSCTWPGQVRSCTGQGSAPLTLR